jgi:hypothetical protein
MNLTNLSLYGCLTMISHHIINHALQCLARVSDALVHEIEQKCQPHVEGASYASIHTRKV